MVIVMSKKKLEAIRHFKTFNIGDWLSSKIYADARANACECGGKFDDKQSIEGIDFPVCASCGKTPKKYRIRAKVIDETNTVKYIDIRHDSMGRRLIKARTCLDLIDRVNDDIKAGKFDVRTYESSKKKDQFLFKNFVPEYLSFQAKRHERGEITEYSFDSKKKYSKMLLKYFGKYDIAKITTPLIETYRNSFTDKFSNRDMSLGELKTILNHALKMEKISKVPRFEVQSSKKRSEVPDLSVTREKVLPAVKDPGKREAIRMLDDYGLRPCEVRAIQFEQLSFFNKRIKIDRHFSKRTMVDGRKSIKKGEKMAILDRPWTPELEAYINSKKWTGNPKEFLFTTSTGTALGPQDLSEAWAEAEKAVGVKHTQMYGIRGAKITEILEKDGVTKAKNFAGHTSAVMTLSRYDHSSTNVDELFG
jgi:integrase